MREHLTELLPLLLVGIVLLAFQLTRDNGPVVHFLPVAEAVATPTPTPKAVGPATAAPRTRTPVANRAPAAASASCNASKPSFVGGMSELKASLGAAMGDALECERSIDDQGNTQQKTTTGLAYYRKQSNVACFTTGWDHWALKADGLKHWAGDIVDPPVAD